jgi:hypothetical protein
MQSPTKSEVDELLHGFDDAAIMISQSLDEPSSQRSRPPERIAAEP